MEQSFDKATILQAVAERGIFVVSTARKVNQVASLRVWANRQGLHVSVVDGVPVVSKKKKAGTAATILAKIQSGEGAFVVDGTASTVRNYIVKYNAEHSTDWKVSTKAGGKSFVIYKLPTK